MPPLILHTQAPAHVYTHTCTHTHAHTHTHTYTHTHAHTHTHTHIHMHKIQHQLVFHEKHSKKTGDNQTLLKKQSFGVTVLECLGRS